MRIFYKKPIIFFAAAMALALCAYQTKKIIDHPNDPLIKDIDASVKPGEDFFKYANGAWFKQNPIPAAYSQWGIGNQVNEEIRDRLKKINEDALKANAPNGTAIQKIGDFYYTGLDSAGIEKAGISPLQAQLALIEKASNVTDILNAAAVLTTNGARNILAMRVEQDDKKQCKNDFAVWPGRPWFTQPRLLF